MTQAMTTAEIAPFFKKNRETTITMTRDQLGTILNALCMAIEFAAPYEDVIDGDDGVPMPNDAMCLLRDLDEAMAIADPIFEKSKPA